MAKFVFKVNHYKKASRFKSDSTIHVIASTVAEVISILDDNDFNSEGIISINKLDEVRSDYDFD